MNVKKTNDNPTTLSAPKLRLDAAMLLAGLVKTRSQAEGWIRLGRVNVNDKIVRKPGFFVRLSDEVRLSAPEQYVGRAGLKLASVARDLALDFREQVVLDVGSSTGGFTDYALQHGASLVYAVDVGTDQMDRSLRDNPKIQLHEKTDIRDFVIPSVDPKPDIVLIDVSFISLRQVLPYIAQNLAKPGTKIVAMVKPQFEAKRSDMALNRGVVKNEAQRRQILRDFEMWSRQYFSIAGKRDSGIAGAHGNRERFYLLSVLKR